jgi:hypothetical protein
MPFTVQDYTDLARLLVEHPEWRLELRRLLLSDDLLSLPEVVRILAEAQQRTGERLGRLESIVEALAVQVQGLATQVQALAEAQRRTEEGLRLLATVQERTATAVGDFKGQLLELKYREHVGGYFGLWLRRSRVVAPETLEDTLEAALSHEDLLEVLRLDLLVSGRLRDQPDAPEVWLAVEVAAVVNEADVDRARRRAALLHQAGYRALPVVAGERVTFEAEASARAQNVVLLQDGQGLFWDQALAAWPAV